MERTVYLIKTAKGFVGTRRFNYDKGSHANQQAEFKYARLFSRKSDAELSVGQGSKGRIVTATVTLDG